MDDFRVTIEGMIDDRRYKKIVIRKSKNSIWNRKSFNRKLIYYLHPSGFTKSNNELSEFNDQEECRITGSEGFHYNQGRQG